MAITPKSSWPWVTPMLHSVYDQIDAKAVAAQFDRVTEALGEKVPAVADHLGEARKELLAFTRCQPAVLRRGDLAAVAPRTGTLSRAREGRVH